MISRYDRLHLAEGRGGGTIDLQSSQSSMVGGVFERMIRMPKLSLKKIIGRARLTLDKFNTLITEVEGVSYQFSTHFVRAL